MWFYVNLNDDVAQDLEVGYVEHHPRGWVDPPCHSHLQVKNSLQYSVVLQSQFQKQTYNFADNQILLSR